MGTGVVKALLQPTNCKFDFQVPGLKVKVTVGILRKTLSSL